MQQESTERVGALMLEFAAQTGLSSSVHPRRYLWTDAYAVCNFLSLHHRTRDNRFRQLALELIAQVHDVLGRFRDDDPRQGWISGLDDATGARHPTAGGLRIGKKHAEREREDPYDAHSEWDRDGQYFHYLTKWMHALMRAGETTQEAVYIRWAVELAETAHAAFVYSAGAWKQMYWKMSTDLSYALTPSMGHHDPLDGLVTACSLEACAEKMAPDQELPDLVGQIADYNAMCAGRRWDTTDALGLGGLLFDAARILRLAGSRRTLDPPLLREVLAAADRGLTTLTSTNALARPACERLAFRELGLAIGIHSLFLSARSGEPEAFMSEYGGDIRYLIDRIGRFVPLTKSIEDFWLNDQNQRANAWREHRDINMVMLASSLLPDSMLGAERRSR